MHLTSFYWLDQGQPRAFRDSNNRPMAALIAVAAVVQSWELVGTDPRVVFGQVAASAVNDQVIFRSARELNDAALRSCARTTLSLALWPRRPSALGAGFRDRVRVLRLHGERSRLILIAGAAQSWAARRTARCCR